MTRRKHAAPETAEITAWPSSPPENVGSFAPVGSELPVDHDDLGRRFLTDALEQPPSLPAPWSDEYDEGEFDMSMADELLRSFGLDPPRRRSTTRPIPRGAAQRRALAPPPIPEEFEEYLQQTDELDLTDMNVHEASLLDHEGDEPGEVESPRLRTEDTHTHGKPRGGHARTSLRPPGARARR